MVGDRDRDDSRPDDVFDDLDRFFSPIEDPAWPEEGGAGSGERRSAEGGDRPREPETRETQPGDDLGDARPAAEDPRPTTAEDLEPSSDATGELSHDDWVTLHDVLGEEEDAMDDLDVSLPEPGAGPDQFGFDELGGATTAGAGARPGTSGGGASRSAGVSPSDEDDRPPAISVDDLKKAPPQYRDLPGAASEQEEGRRSRLARAFEAPEPSSARAGTPAGAESGEPSLADVEAEADRLAEEFRSPAELDEDQTLEESPARAAQREPAAPTRPEPRRIKVGEPEAMLGPTWEDPTSRPVMGEPEPSATGRNVPVAILTAAGLALAALIALAWQRWAFALVAGLVVLLGQAEFYATMKRRGHQPATALGLVAGGLLLASSYLRGEPAMLFSIALSLVVSFLWYMAAAPRARAGLLASIAATMLGILYVPFLASFTLLILIQENSGQVLLLAVLGLTFWYDVAAFVVGTVWGNRAIAPTISPKKSLEGLVGATVSTFLVAVALLPSIDVLSTVTALGLAGIVVVFAPLGDLAESALKRDIGVKDMGSILPGHGGMLDRIDSALWVAPAAFYFFRLIF
ncbi:MAG: phosphatidate cytidylyltransferase [Actinobacteria bacterium]|nr:phosphatidate cytidylyltransferase [Actinomycetota bacterium]